MIVVYSEYTCNLFIPPSSFQFLHPHSYSSIFIPILAPIPGSLNNDLDSGIISPVGSSAGTSSSYHSSTLPLQKRRPRLSSDDKRVKVWDLSCIIVVVVVVIVVCLFSVETSG